MLTMQPSDRPITRLCRVLELESGLDSVVVEFLRCSCASAQFAQLPWNTGRQLLTRLYANGDYYNKYYIL